MSGTEEETKSVRQRIEEWNGRQNLPQFSSLSRITDEERKHAALAMKRSENLRRMLSSSKPLTSRPKIWSLDQSRTRDNFSKNEGVENILPTETQEQPTLAVSSEPKYEMASSKMWEEETNKPDSTEAVGVKGDEENFYEQLTYEPIYEPIEEKTEDKVDKKIVAALRAIEDAGKILQKTKEEQVNFLSRLTGARTRFKENGRREADSKITQAVDSNITANKSKQLAEEIEKKAMDLLQDGKSDRYQIAALLRAADRVTKAAKSEELFSADFKKKVGTFLDKNSKDYLGIGSSRFGSLRLWANTFPRRKLPKVEPEIATETQERGYVTVAEQENHYETIGDQEAEPEYVDIDSLVVNDKGAQYKTLPNFAGAIYDAASPSLTYAMPHDLEATVNLILQHIDEKQEPSLNGSAKTYFLNSNPEQLTVHYHDSKIDRVELSFDQDGQAVQLPLIIRNWQGKLENINNCGLEHLRNFSQDLSKENELSNQEVSLEGDYAMPSAVIRMQAASQLDDSANQQPVEYDQLSTWTRMVEAERAYSSLSSLARKP